MALINNRYEILEPLGSGGMGEVFRCYDRLTDSHVALKRVGLAPQDTTSTSNDETVNSSLSLVQEFQTLASLRHPNVIDVLDYGFDDTGAPFFTMTLLQDARTIVQASEKASVETRINLILQMFQAIAYLHRRGILHRDLKPGNVMVDPTGKVKVLDFGLAVQRDQMVPTAGTILYMAPEIIRGDTVTEASDLFAAGVIAYETLTGKHPFSAQTITELLTNILGKSPDISALHGEIKSDEMPAELPTMVLANLEQPLVIEELDMVNGSALLAAVIGKLLHKEPVFRYQRAEEVMRDLSRAIEQPLPEESAAIRESYLQAATFIGREAELEKLRNALHQASDKMGNIWFISGESGVGKSRLINELRAYAMVAGLRMVKGQTVEDDGRAYGPWQDILPALLLSADVPTQTASILKPLVPNIEKLLDRPVPDIPRLDGDQAKERLTSAIAEVITLQKSPVLIVLEDLHWSQDSLEPIQIIADDIPTLPLMVAITYRDDEISKLSLPGSEHIHLPRLVHDEVRALTNSMLGDRAIHDPALIEFIERETEGNTFFIVEVVRVLAEEAGRLSKISNELLSGSILTVGIEEIMERRLSHISDDYKPLLWLVAVIGRQIDIGLLNQLRPEEDMQDFLYACNEAAVLEVTEYGWQFSHDKIRHAVLQQIPPDKLVELNAEVAVAIEQLHPDELEYAPLLANHWRVAGRVDKQLHYAIKGSERLTRFMINIGLANQLLEDALVVADDPTTRATIYRLLGDAAEHQANYLKATSYYKEALALFHENDLLKVKALIGLSTVAHHQGQNQQAAEYAAQALEIAEVIDSHQGRLECHEQLATIATRQGEYDTAETHFLASLSLVSDQRDRPRLLSGLGLIAYYQGKYIEATRYLSESRNAMQVMGNPRGEAMTLKALGSVLLAESKFQEATTIFQQAFEKAAIIGDRRMAASALNNLGMVAVRQGDLDKAELYFKRCADMYQRVDDAESAAGILLNLGLLNYRHGRHSVAEHYYNQSLERFEKIGNPMAIAMLLNNLALIYRDRYELLTALDYHTRSLEIRRTLDNRYMLVNCLNDIAYVSILLNDLQAGIKAISEAYELIRDDDESTTYKLACLLALAEIAARQEQFDLLQKYLNKLLSMQLEIGPDDQARVEALQIILASEGLEATSDEISTLDKVLADAVAAMRRDGDKAEPTVADANH